MLYFAYGSNMDPVQMRRRCPGARFWGVARLDGHRLAFTRRSPRRRCGVADIVAEMGAEVWGVVYRLGRRSDIRRLDRAEGHDPSRRRANRYHRETRRVEPAWLRRSEVALASPRRAGGPRRSLTVETYIARPTRHVPPPTAAYMGHLLRGAHHWGLPADYTAWLAEIPTGRPA